MRGVLLMVTKTSIDKKILRTAQKYKQVLERSGLHIQALYVFGSQAKGTAHKWSDTDIGVVSPDFIQKRFDEGVKLSILSREVDDFIEPHPFTPEDFNDKYYTLAQEVKRTGVKI